MVFELLFIPIGMLIGAFAGFFGIGGGIILIPILLISGFNSALTVATSLMFVFGTSLSGAMAHTRMNHVDWKTASIIGGTGILLSQVANRIQLAISGGYDWIFSLAYIILLSYFAWSLYRNQKKETQPRLKNPYASALLIGSFVGAISTLLGIGGGLIIPPLLISWLGFDTKKAIGTSLASVLFVALGGVVGYAFQMELNYMLGICLIIGAMIGTPFGARMTVLYQLSEITGRLAMLYFFAIASISIDLLSLVISPVLEYVSLSLLIFFLFFMLFDFYRHRRPAKTGNT